MPQDTNLEAKLARTERELSDALEQQAATLEVLRVIASSPGELERVFETMLANATRLCEASYGAMFLCEGDAFRTGAIHGALPAAFIEQWRSTDEPSRSDSEHRERPPSTGRRAPCNAPAPSRMRSSRSGSRFVPAFTPENAK